MKYGHGGATRSGAAASTSSNPARTRPGFSETPRTRARSPGSTNGASTARPSSRPSPSPPYTSFSTVISKSLRIKITPSTTLSYQWLLSTNNGSTFATIGNTGVYTGATTATLTLTNVPNTMDGYVYECAITPSSCTALTSSAGTLRVNSLTAATVNSPTICAAANTTLTVTPTRS